MTRTRPASSPRAGGRRINGRLVVTVIVLALLVGMYTFVASLADREYSRKIPIASVFSSAPEGLKYLYEYLRELDVEVHPLQQFESLPENGTIIIASETFFPKAVSPRDVDRLTAWVEDGGRVVVAGVMAVDAFQAPLLDGLDVQNSYATDEAEPAAPTRYAADVTRASLGTWTLTGVTEEWVTAYDDAGACVVTRRYGKGEVVVMASVYAMSNDGLAEQDNARVATLLAAAGARPVYFDEYHQGYARGGSMFSRLSVAGRTGVLLALAALLVAVVARARRLGPPIPQAEAPAARSSAYIGQLAEVYQRAGARTHALTVLEEALTRALRRRHGTLPAGLSLHPDAAAVLERSAALRTHEKIEKDEFVEVARALAQARRDVEERHG